MYLSTSTILFKRTGGPMKRDWKEGSEKGSPL